MGHGLLVMAAPGGHMLASAVERLAQPRHIAVSPENGPDARDECVALRRHLVGQIAHQCLRGGQSNGFHISSILPPRESVQ